MIFSWLGLPSGKACPGLPPKTCGRPMKRYEWMNGRCDDCNSHEIRREIAERRLLQERLIANARDQKPWSSPRANKQKGGR